MSKTIIKKNILLLLLLTTITASAQNDSLDAKYGHNLLKSGTIAPDFSMYTADDKCITLSNYRGSYVVLDFWASWCPDCRKDIPAMKELFDEFSSQNVNFVGISFDTNKEAWINCFWNTYKMYWTQVSELKKWKHGTNIDKLYHVDWIPTMYLIDPQGKIVFGTVDINKLRTALRKISEPTLTAEQITEKFPGGKAGFGKYIDANRVYPPIAKKFKAEGRVICRFNVEFSGHVNGASAIRVEDFKINSTKKFSKLSSRKQQAIANKCIEAMKNEAVRVINNMPAWKPATENGKPVQAQYFMPIEFMPKR